MRHTEHVMFDCGGNVIGPNPWHNTVNYLCVTDQFGLDTVFVHKICANFSYLIFHTLNVLQKFIYIIFFNKHVDSYM